MFLRLVLGVALNYLGMLLQKPPKGPKAVTAGEFDIIRADEGAHPLAFGGTVIQRSAHVTAFGGFTSKPIKKRPKKK